MNFPSLVRIGLALTSSLCYGAADNGQAVQKFVGFGCKSGTLGVHHSPCRDGMQIYTYAHTTDPYITQTQLQEIAAQVMAARGENRAVGLFFKERDKHFLDSLDPEKRSFSLDKSVATHLAFGMFILVDKQYCGAVSKYEYLTLFAGKKPGVSSYHKTARGLAKFDKEEHFRVMRMGVCRQMSALITTDKSLDESAAEIATTTSGMEDDAVVGVVDVQAWMEQVKKDATCAFL